MVVAVLGGLLAGTPAASQAATATAAAASTTANTTWAPAATATIRPGVQLTSEAGQCTANFVFQDDHDVYIGSAAHCTTQGGATDVNGCTTPSLPLGTPITIQGASRPGTLAYHSWRLMQAVGETDPNACRYNDLALIRIDPADVGKVNPSVPHWGGPVALGRGTTLLERVYSYGNSSLRLGLTLLGPKTGLSLGDTGGGWSHTVYTVTPGIPGDSGSAFLDSAGQALGVLSTVALAPLALSNGVGNLRHELDYLAAHSGGEPVPQLVAGTELFQANRLPLGGL